MTEEPVVTPMTEPVQHKVGKKKQLKKRIKTLKNDIKLLKKENEDCEKTVKDKKIIKKYQEEKSLKPFQAELIQMQKYLEETQRRMIILFEGRDASGKGGTIRRVTRYMNEKHYRIVALGKPTDHQKTEWFFQKYIAELPHGGETVLFDRSWYNRAMVEPVFDFCTEKQYKDFMKGVVGFEKDLVRQGTIVVKLYFSVSKSEQSRRFERRKDDPLKQWKLSEVDLQAQERWDDFTEQKYQMLRRTHTNTAPWTVIRSNDKYLARLNAIKAILNAVPYDSLNSDIDYVLDPEVVISGAREVELMEAQQVKRGKMKA
ncbi:MAG: polyphosphate kinase 2 [Cocleimonas sp.]|nr:polyphosphate kinase 2 [Cocleimonas sp.]